MKRDDLADELTHLLRQATAGDEAALEKAYARLHSSLRRLVFRRMATADQISLDATMVINDLWMRLIQKQEIRWKDRRHFFRLAARMIRQLLCDRARNRGAAKRGGGWKRVSLDDAPQLEARESAVQNVDLVELDGALKRLEAGHPDLLEVVELRYFAGLATEQVAHVLELNAGTVRRRWSKAKMLLQHYLTAGS